MTRRAALPAAAALVSGLLVAVAASSTPATSSYLYDLETVKGEFSAGTWQTTPAICDEVLDLQDSTTVEGRESGDIIIGWLLGTARQPMVILGLGGTDVIKGGKKQDCLVGGEGGDWLFAFSFPGGAKDILLGGPGDDVLVSGSDDDYLDGGPGFDYCFGDDQDTIRNCECILNEAFTHRGFDLKDLKAELETLSVEDAQEMEQGPAIANTRPQHEDKTPADRVTEESTLLPEPDEEVEETAPVDETATDEPSEGTDPIETSTPDVQEPEFSEPTDTEPSPDESAS